MREFTYLILLYKSTAFLPPGVGALPEKNFDMNLKLKYAFPKRQRSCDMKTDLKRVCMGKIGEMVVKFKKGGSYEEKVVSCIFFSICGIV